MEKHFAELPRKCHCILPNAWQQRMATILRPAFAMLVTVYGHPASGKILVDECITTLQRKGWVQVTGDQAMVQRQGNRAIVDVDDVQGVREGIETTWTDFR